MEFLLTDWLTLLLKSFKLWHHIFSFGGIGVMLTCCLSSWIGLTCCSIENITSLFSRHETASNVRKVIAQMILGWCKIIMKIEWNRLMNILICYCWIISIIFLWSSEAEDHLLVVGLQTVSISMSSSSPWDNILSDKSHLIIIIFVNIG